MLKKRRILIGLLVLLLGVVLWGMTQGSRWHFNPITHYKVLTPVKQVKHNEIDQAVKPFLGQSFWTIDLDKLQASLVKIDWIYDADVRRQWPSVLLLSIEEQNPVVRWGETALLNNYGDIFYPHDIQAYQNLVRLQGIDAHAKKILSRLQVYQNKFAILGWRIKMLSEAADGVWNIQFVKAPPVVLDEKNWQQKLDRFILAYPKVKLAIRKNAIKIDLRYSNGFVVKNR